MFINSKQFSLTSFLILYLIIVIIVFILAQCMKIRFISALMLALLFGYVIMLVLYNPFNRVVSRDESDVLVLIYIAIIYLTPIALIGYVIGCAILDRPKNESLDSLSLDKFL